MIYIDFVTLMPNAGMYCIVDDVEKKQMWLCSGAPLGYTLCKAREIAKILKCKLVIDGIEDDGSILSEHSFMCRHVESYRGNYESL